MRNLIAQNHQIYLVFLVDQGSTSQKHAFARIRAAGMLDAKKKQYPTQEKAEQAAAKITEASGVALRIEMAYV